MLFKEKIKYFFIILFIFTNLYYLLDENEIKNINELSHNNNNNNSYLYCLHFAIITQTTVGYGHMYPNSERGRMLVSIHCLVTAYIFLA